MTKFPVPLHERLAANIKAGMTQLRLHTQQIVNLQTSVATVVPGDWEDITLSNGWANIPGYIPAQVRILQNGMSQLVGHIEGGTVSNGTIIGTLTSGYFNAVHAHAFTANAITGAAAVAHAGALNNTNGAITQSNTMLPTGDHSLPVAISNVNIPTGNHTFTIPSGGGSFTLGPGGTQFSNSAGNGGAAGSIGPSSGIQFANAINGASTNLNDGSTATNVNMNTPTITLSVSGVLTINNVDPNVSQLSFSELIPLITA